MLDSRFAGLDFERKGEMPSGFSGGHDPACGFEAGRRAGRGRGRAGGSRVPGCRPAACAGRRGPVGHSVRHLRLLGRAAAELWQRRAVPDAPGAHHFPDRGARTDADPGRPCGNAPRAAGARAVLPVGCGAPGHLRRLRAALFPPAARRAAGAPDFPPHAATALRHQPVRAGRGGARADRCQPGQPRDPQAALQRGCGHRAQRHAVHAAR